MKKGDDDDALFEVCVCNKIIQLFFRYLWENKLSLLEKPAANIPRWSIRMVGGGWLCVKYLWIHEPCLPDSSFTHRFPAPMGCLTIEDNKTSERTIQCDFIYYN